MRLDEISSRDLGVKYDEGKAIQELEEALSILSPDELAKVANGKKEQLDEVRSILRTLKITAHLHSPENKAAFNGLVNLLENMCKREMTQTYNLVRKLKRR